MKLVTNFFLIFCLSVSFVNAQTILVNNNVISVQNDVTFPLWLDSMSTIGIGTQVVSISALEFNIVTANNGNSLVFSQTKTITSQETVPNGMTWKITAVLFDSTTISTTTESSITTIENSGAKAIALSSQSANSMNMGDALLYCDSLVEDGFDNWVVPTLEEIMFVAGGGGDVPGTRTSDYLWSISMNSSSGNERIFTYNFTIRLSDGSMNLNNNITKYGTQSQSPSTVSGPFISTNYVRCVRHKSISTSTSGSSSGGSNSASSLGNNMPTMLSNESLNTMLFYEAMIYCDSLNEFGYNDWILPNFEQLSYAISGGCVINDARSQEYIWSRSMMEYTGGQYFKTIKTTGTYTIESKSPNVSIKCRCVR